MYACIDRVLRMCKDNPLYIKYLFFMAYARPVALYCAECLPYTNQQLEQFDKITLQYARWALGFQFKKVSSRLITFYELGLKPIHFDIMHSRISYLLHLLSRNHDHYTTCALSEIIVSLLGVP